MCEVCGGDCRLCLPKDEKMVTHDLKPSEDLLRQIRCVDMFLLATDTIINPKIDRDQFEVCKHIIKTTIEFLEEKRFPARLTNEY